MNTSSPFSAYHHRRRHDRHRRPSTLLPLFTEVINLLPSHPRLCHWPSIYRPSDQEEEEEESDLPRSSPPPHLQAATSFVFFFLPRSSSIPEEEASSSSSSRRESPTSNSPRSFGGEERKIPPPLCWLPQSPLPPLSSRTTKAKKGGPYSSSSRNLLHPGISRIRTKETNALRRPDQPPPSAAVRSIFSSPPL